MNRTRTILVGEDDPEVRGSLETALRSQGYSVELAENGEQVLACLENKGSRISLILLGIFMPGKDGIDALREIRSRRPEVPVIMLSGNSSPMEIVEAMKSGATDFLTMPTSHEELGQAIQKALGSSSDPAESGHQETVGAGATGVFSWPQDSNMDSLLARIGASDVPVLLQGETGVGKEVLARRLHAHSPRAQRPFLKVNCAALPSELVESELFGYERGAFTGALTSKPGKFERADGGTILLDEIGDMDFKLQAKLLHVLQDQEFERLGGREPVRVNVRVMAATHCDLEAAVREGRFRGDLYYRLNVISVQVPPLRDRRDEIVPLAEFLLNKHGSPGKVPCAITPALRRAFLAYHWPGNVRELENAIRRYLVLQNAELLARELSLKTLGRRPTALTGGNGAYLSTKGPVLDKVDEAKRRDERQVILAALNATNWNRKRAAQLLRIDYKALLYRLKKLAREEENEEASLAVMTATTAAAPPLE